MTALWKTPEIQDEGYGIIKQFRRVTVDAVPEYIHTYVNGSLVH